MHALRGLDEYFILFSTGFTRGYVPSSPAGIKDTKITIFLDDELSRLSPGLGRAVSPKPQRTAQRAVPTQNTRTKNTISFTVKLCDSS